LWASVDDALVDGRQETFRIRVARGERIVDAFLELLAPDRNRPVSGEHAIQRCNELTVGAVSICMKELMMLEHSLRLVQDVERELEGNLVKRPIAAEAWNCALGTSRSPEMKWGSARA
jgi:hypothetical protein